MAKIINKYLDKIETTKLKMNQDADEILNNIDMDELLKDPERYLMALGDAFLEEHKEEIAIGYKAGEQLATEILEKL